MADIDGLIEELAFGKVRRKSGPCIGMYLSPEVIYLAETHIERGGIVVDHLVRIPVPAPDKNAMATAPQTGTLNTDFLADNLKLQMLIKQSMGAIRWSTNEVFVTLSHHLGLLRYFTMPAVDRRYWSNAVPLEAKKYIPIAFDTLASDFQVVPMPPDAQNKPRQGALISVTQRRNIANVTQLLDALDLKMIGMEVAPCSVLRVWETMDTPRAGKTHCQVHFDGGNIRILLADRGLPVFFRELFLGKEAQLNDIRKVDLGGCLGFAQKQLGVGEIGQVLVSGNIPNLAEWQEAFSRDLNVKAGVQDTAKRLSIKGGDWGGYAAVGSSLRYLAQTPSSLDLGQLGRVSDDERRAAKNILVAGGALALFFVLVGGWRTVSYNLKARELERYKSDPEIERMLMGKPQSHIEEQLRMMRAQVTAMEPAMQGSLRGVPLLTDVVNSLPDNTWLTEIRYSHPLSRNSGDGIRFELSGRATAPNTAAEQDLAFEYRHRLMKSPALGKIFGDVQVDVAKNNQEMLGGDAGSSPDRVKEMLEDRTKFTISMRKKL